MTQKIDQKITACQVLKPEDETTAESTPTTPAKAANEPAGPDIIQMHEALQRPERLLGASYKIKSPLFEHALYVTINDIVLNEGTEHEQRRPFEIFINSKNMDHFQWIVALTRIISAVFRKGGDVTFLVEELQAVFDPRGGYFKPGGVYMPSIVAEIGAVIERHLKAIGLIHDPEITQSQRELMAEKRAEFEARQTSASGESEADAAPAGDFPAGAELCGKCNTKALVMLDGCQTCLNCGYSKCG